MQKLCPKAKQQVAFKKIVVSAIFCLAMVGMVVPRGVMLASGYMPAPTILGPEMSATENPTIVGVTKNGTNVAVYIDDVFQGHAEIKEGVEGTASFAYTPYLSVKPGEHTVQVRAEKKDGSQWSELSTGYEMMVKYPYPAPTLYQPVVDDTTVRTQPYMVGLVKSNSYVEIYIDNELVDTIWVEDSENEVVDFAYKSDYLNPNADHHVYARAKGENGKMSHFSNVVGFKIQAVDAESTEVSEEVASEEASEDTEEVVEAEENTEEAQNEEEVVTEEEEEEVNNENEEENSDEVDEEEEVDENEENQSVASEEDTDEDSAKDNEYKDTEEAKSDEDDEDAEEEESNLVLWLVVIAVVIIIVVTRLTSKSDEDDDDDNSQGSLFDNNDAETKSTGVVDVKETEKNNSQDSSNSSGSSSY